MIALSATDQGRVYVEHLATMLADADKRSRKMVGDELLVENGKRQILETLLHDFETARDVMNRFEKAKKKGQQ